MSQERYDFTIAVSRVGDPDCREQGTITNCPLSSVLVKNTFLQAELVDHLVTKLKKRINPTPDESGEIKLVGSVTVTEIDLLDATATWPPGNIQQEIA